MTESSRARPESAFAHLMQQPSPQEKKNTPRHDTTRRNLSARSRIHPASPDCATASCGYGPFSQLGGGRRTATGACYGCNNNHNKRQDAAAAAAVAACGGCVTPLVAWPGPPRTGLDSEPKATRRTPSRQRQRQRNGPVPGHRRWDSKHRACFPNWDLGRGVGRARPEPSVTFPPVISAAMTRMQCSCRELRMCPDQIKPGRSSAHSSIQYSVQGHASSR